MVRLKIRPGMLLLPALLVLALRPSIGAESSMKPPAVDYSATMVRETSGRTSESKIFYSQNRVRSETVAGGHQRISIVDRDKHEMISLDPGTKTYFKMDLKGQADADPNDAPKYTPTLEGKEAIDGIETTKYSYAGTVQGMPYKGTTWVTKDNIALKTESSVEMNGQVIRTISLLKNLHVEKQEASLFELPAGYSAMAVPGMPKQ